MVTGIPPQSRWTIPLREVEIAHLQCTGGALPAHSAAWVLKDRHVGLLEGLGVVELPSDPSGYD